MRLLRCFLIVFAAVIPITLIAQTEGTHSIDSTLSMCLDTHLTTPGMVQCLVTAQQQWDTELNQAYNDLLSILNADSKNNLRKAQREWVKLRDQEFEFINGWYGAMNGTIWQIVVAELKMQFIKRRALDLRGYIDAIDLER